MKLRNELTGDVLEVPPPDRIGQSVILLNGEIVERVFYSDENGGSVTLGDGRRFAPGSDFVAHVIQLLKLTPEQRSEIAPKAGKAGGRGRKKEAE